MSSFDAVETLGVCPACDGPRLTTLPTPGRWIGESVFGPHRDKLGLCRCADCGLVFVNPRPTEALLAQFYQGNDYACHLPNWSEHATAAARTQLASVEQMLPLKGRFLDFGCGGGYLLRSALERGWDAVGYDPGERAIAECREQGLPVTGDLGTLEGRRFDAIYLSHVFEHVAEPGPLIRGLVALLAPDGRIVIEVPNEHSLRARLSVPALCRWIGFDERYRAFPIHLFYYSGSSLSTMLGHHGLDVLRHTTSGMGLDEMIFHEEHGPLPPAAHLEISASHESYRARAKHLVKAAFLEAGLGENLVFAAVARPGIHAQAQVRTALHG